MFLAWKKGRQIQIEQVILNFKHVKRLRFDVIFDRLVQVHKDSTRFYVNFCFDQFWTPTVPTVKGQTILKNSSMLIIKHDFFKKSFFSFKFWKAVLIWEIQQTKIGWNFVMLVARNIFEKAWV